MYFTSLGGCTQCANEFLVPCLSWTSLPVVLPCPPQRWLPWILKLAGFSRLCRHKLLINEVHRSVMVRYFLLEFIGLPEHSCLITACTVVYALINQRSFAEMGWITMNLSVGIFPLQAQMMEQTHPIWLFCKRTHSGKAVFSAITEVTGGSRSEGTARAVSDSVEWSHLQTFITVIIDISWVVRVLFSLPGMGQPSLISHI